MANWYFSILVKVVITMRVFVFEAFFFTDLFN